MREPCEGLEAGVGDQPSDVEARLLHEVLQRLRQMYGTQSHVQRVVNASVETEVGVVEDSRLLLLPDIRPAKGHTDLSILIGTSPAGDSRAEGRCSGGFLVLRHWNSFPQSLHCFVFQPFQNKDVPPIVHHMESRDQI